MMADREETVLLVNNKSDGSTTYQAVLSPHTTTSVDLVELGSEDADEITPYLNPEYSGSEDGHRTDCLPTSKGTEASQNLPTDYVKQDHGRVPSEEELIFRLRFAHLTPETCWFDEVRGVGRATGDMGVYLRVLASLREYPLTIREKMRLSEQLRAKLDVGSVASSTTNLTANKVDSRPNQKGRKSRHSHKWTSGLSAPFGLWENNIARIAAYFGSHVASYFQFLRFLAVMNAGITIIMFLFVSLPQIVPWEVWSADVRSGFLGELSNTIFFYGAYNNTSVTIGVNGLTYNRPLAYLMTWSVGNVLGILVIVFSMFVSYRRIKKSDDSVEDPFSSHTFLGWDHSVTSREGSKIRSLAITTHIKEILREVRVKRHRDFRETIKLWCGRLVCNILSVSILAASSYIIYFVAEESITPGLAVPRVVGDFLEEYLLAIVIMCLKVFIPPLLSLLLLLERYHPRTQIKVQMARTAVFYVASLVVFLASVYSVATKCLPTSATGPAEADYCCWENEVGETLFQVVVLDLAFTLTVGVVVTGGRAALVRFCQYKKFGYQDINVGDLILDLVYGQSLIWLGLFFAPFLALVGALKMIFLFYFNYALAWTCCVPPAKVFRASRSGTFYLFVLLVTLFVCLLPMTYAVIQLQPSTSCGPFKHDLHVYLVLTDRIGDAPVWFQDILTFAITPAVVIPVFIVLFPVNRLIILYYRAKSTVHKMEAKELRYMLQFERKVEKRRIFARAKLEHGVSVMSGIDT